MLSVYFGASIVWAPSNRPPSAALVEEIINTTKVEIAYLAPSTIEEMMLEPSSRTALEGLSAVGYGSGPLSHEVGNLLNQKTRLLNTIGSTEICAPPIYLKDQEDWEYFHYNPLHTGIKFRPTGDGTYEKVFVRDPSSDDFHATWWTFPEKAEYFMNDLYTKHPSKPNYWLYVGRADDVIVLSNGEKLNPTGMEATLRSHPAVKGALVVGQGHFAPGAIIELKDDAPTKLAKNAEKGLSSKRSGSLRLKLINLRLRMRS
jgi:acyl-coenzyme A synthetase/AMP-(fatty) acid ligase